MKNIKRVYHPYWKWEETQSQMWRCPPTDKKIMLLMAIDFTGNSIIYGSAMKRVIKEWPISCEHNLSNVSQNRKAWLGHAACALEKGFCESIVRQAWSYLTEQQQMQANQQAETVIKRWEECQKEN